MRDRWRMVLGCLVACSSAPPRQRSRQAVPARARVAMPVDFAEPKRESPMVDPDPPEDPATDAVEASSFHYLDDLDQRFVGRILKAESVQAGRTEITISSGSDKGVASDWRLAILDGDTDLPLSGGDVRIVRVDTNVTIGVVSIATNQLGQNSRVRFLPPAPPPPTLPPRPTKAPHRIARIEIHYSWGTLHCSNDHRYAIDWTGTGYESGTTKIDSALVDALYDSLGGLTSSVVEQTCTAHTDDYPEMVVAFGEYPQTPEVVLTSSSDCEPDNAPWNVLRGGNRFVQTSGPIGGAVHALLEAIDPVRWKPSGDPRINWYTGCDGKPKGRNGG